MPLRSTQFKEKRETLQAKTRCYCKVEQFLSNDGQSAVCSVLHGRKVTKACDCTNFATIDSLGKIFEEVVSILKSLVDSTGALSSGNYPSTSCILPMFNLGTCRKSKWFSLVNELKVKL